MGTGSPPLCHADVEHALILLATLTQARTQPDVLPLGSGLLRVTDTPF